MDVITTHVNADFDSLGAMVAAKKLYPEAVLAFSGSQESNLRRFLIESSLYAFDVRRARSVDLDAVRRLILVDVAQADRIGRFARVVGRPGVEIHLYDHHPASPEDVAATVRHVEPVGAATTVLAELIRERRIPIDRDVATMMILGIYEDTGGLLFSTTTPRDLEAAAFLLSQGADLNAVVGFMTPELTVEQVSLLDELLSSRQVHRVHGIPVTLVEASRDHYVGDLAVLVHKIRDMENLDALVAMVRMEGEVQVVARSRIPEVDVGRLARALGGGGHPEAASAAVRDLTLIQVRDRVLSLLAGAVRPPVAARDICTAPVKHVEEGTTLGEVQSLLERYHINAMPVVRDGVVKGIVTRQLVGRAAHHGLDRAPVEDYMVAEFATVAPDAPLERVKDLIVRGNQRFLPVVDRGRLVGAVTRTDLLRALDGAAIEPVELPRAAHRRGALRMVEERLDPALVDRLRSLGRAAADRGMQAFLVGGIVRDLLLRQDNQDVDVVVEGDAIALARAVAEHLDATVRTHDVFGTATLRFADGSHIDVATARTEHYARPAALPSVEWSSLKLDLYRRDFTINTLALRLGPERFGEVIDFFGGLKDLKEGTIRILHNLSFVEDPTRILRALRFQLRFGFDLGRQTRKLLRSAVANGFLAQGRGHRLFQEWVQLLSAADPVEVFERVDEHGVLAAFHPQMRYDGRVQSLVERARDVVTWFELLYLDTPLRAWMVYQLALLDPLDADAAREWARSFGVAQREGRELLEVRDRAYQALGALRLALHGGRPVPDSAVYRILHPCTPETLLFMMAKTRDDEKRRLVSRYYTRLAGTETLLRGRDLKALGIPPGPVYGRLLEGLLYARLDGQVRTRADEERWVLERWNARTGPAA